MNRKMRSHEWTSEQAKAPNRHTAQDSARKRACLAFVMHLLWIVLLQGLYCTLVHGTRAQKGIDGIRQGRAVAAPPTTRRFGFSLRSPYHTSKCCVFWQRRKRTLQLTCRCIVRRGATRPGASFRPFTAGPPQSHLHFLS